ncbi:MAG: TetR/AcrR family transcriptional regulator [Bacillota bacterium]
MKKSIETKQLLLSTVKNLLSHTADIKVKDITDTAFVNIAAVNYHFDDKDRLVELAMNEIFVDFKYEINNFDPSQFENFDDAIVAFVRLNFIFVKNHIGFFRKITQSGDYGNRYFHDEEFIRIISSKFASMNIDKNDMGISATFTSMLAQVVFAALFFPNELEDIENSANSEFLNTYFSQIKKSFM